MMAQSIKNFRYNRVLQVEKWRSGLERAVWRRRVVIWRRKPGVNIVGEFVALQRAAQLGGVSRAPLHAPRRAAAPPADKGGPLFKENLSLAAALFVYDRGRPVSVRPVARSYDRSIAGATPPDRALLRSVTSSPPTTPPIPPIPPTHRRYVVSTPH